ncbi:putative OPA3-like protein [Pseudolycoriella hygida]|uniref:OPA3-like protein n=1 Tax=Pseudolycoriella hygida TaxID=35572 RepID=A0A9Q0NGH8_9DIPT|nr:putative OPA3-like protein [Pseudolycoriella hygida]
MESYPVLKLGVLVFKQLSQPISNVIKDRAKKSFLFRQYVAMPPAQLYNWLEIKMRMWSLNLGKPTTIPQLNEAMAIELGAKLLGEIILFLVPAAVITFEYFRQAQKESKKEEELLLEKQELVNTVNEIALQLERQDIQIRRLKKTLAALNSTIWFRYNKIGSDEEPPLKLGKLSVPVH